MAQLPFISCFAACLELRYLMKSSTIVFYLRIAIPSINCYIFYSLLSHYRLLHFLSTYCHHIVGTVTFYVYLLLSHNEDCNIFYLLIAVSFIALQLSTYCYIRYGTMYFDLYHILCCNIFISLFLFHVWHCDIFCILYFYHICTMVTFSVYVLLTKEY